MRHLPRSGWTLETQQAHTIHTCAAAWWCFLRVCSTGWAAHGVGRLGSPHPTTALTEEDYCFRR
ncbi:hypothetical protein FG476_12990 [Xylella fastidiosa subsp. multiplex]|uniref:Uncharacterized protein n=1 Tax=Xylella fastidiosa subsp. multiplex TaxID=644357 RepID=A0A9Q4QTD1_XYLFS|nr:hypothetical protein [Xylella fastidiosa]MDC6417522.1 hypothetical protein [Xylella fastidiosa subsp. multiplex]MRU24925.1 hypothetical protein [Xylella fastidiosa subsp. multiplex]